MKKFLEKLRVLRVILENFVVKIPDPRLRGGDVLVEGVSPFIRVIIFLDCFATLAMTIQGVVY